MYEEFVAPIGNGGFDVHVYFHQGDEKEVQIAEAMRRSIKQEFPEFPVYRMHHEPIGPHPIGMFEVDIANPAQFGALVPWLAIHHGPLSILIHPHTGDSRRDHSQNAIWIGKRLSIDLSIFDRFSTKEELAMKLQQLGGVQDLLENRS